MVSSQAHAWIFTKPTTVGNYSQLHIAAFFGISLLQQIAKIDYPSEKQGNIPKNKTKARSHRLASYTQFQQFSYTCSFFRITRLHKAYSKLLNLILILPPSFYGQLHTVDIAHTLTALLASQLGTTNFLSINKDLAGWCNNYSILRWENSEYISQSIYSYSYGIELGNQVGSINEKTLQPFSLSHALNFGLGSLKKRWGEFKCSEKEKSIRKGKICDKNSFFQIILNRVLDIC